MNGFLRYALTLLTVLTSLAALMPSSTAQPDQEETTFVSAVSGLTIDIGDSGFARFNSDQYEIVDVGQGVEMERVGIAVGWSDFTITFFSDNLVDPVSYNQTTLQTHSALPFREVQILGEESTSDAGWLLTRRVLPWGPTEIHYGETRADFGNGHAVAVTVFSHESTMVEHMAWARENVTVDGLPVLPDTDLTAIQTMIDGTGDSAPEIARNESASLSDWAGPGLRSEDEWHNNIHGVVVTWDQDVWEFPYTYRNAIVQSAETNEAQIALHDEGTMSWASIGFVDNNEQRSGQEWETRWSSSEWLGSSYPNRTVLASTSDGDFAGVIYSSTTKYDQPGIVIRVSANLPGDVLMYVDISTSHESATQAYANFIDGTFFDGESMVHLWSSEELDEIISSQQVSDEETPSRLAPADEPDRQRRSGRTSRSASSSEVVVSDIAGATVEFDTSTGAVFHNQLVNREGQEEIEIITILHGDTFIDIFFINNDMSPADYIQTWEEFETSTTSFLEWLGGETGADRAWGVYSSSHYLDYRDYYYIDFTSGTSGEVHVAVIINGSESTFGSDVAWVKENITIDGVSALAEADASLISDIANRDGDYLAEDISHPSTTVEHWAQEGLTSESEWTSPTHDISLSWNDDLWQFTFNRTDAIVVTDESTMVILETADRRGMTKIRVQDARQVPQFWVEQWLSEDYREREAQSGFVFEVVDSYFDDTTGSVILRFETRFGEPVIVIRDVYVNDDGLVIVTEIFAAPGDIADVYADFWDGVQANGDYYPLTWTLEDIQAIPQN